MYMCDLLYIIHVTSFYPGTFLIGIMSRYHNNRCDLSSDPVRKGLRSACDDESTLALKPVGTAISGPKLRTPVAQQNG